MTMLVAHSSIEQQRLSLQSALDSHKTVSYTHLTLPTSDLV